MMSRILILLLIMLGITISADAQIRRRSTSKKQKEKVEEVSIKENLNPEITFGNFGFAGGVYISLRTLMGYKVTPKLTAGIGGKIFYNQFSRVGPDASLFDYAGTVYSRFKITQSVFIQGEYNVAQYADRTKDFISTLSGGNINYPSLGLGYCSGDGPWRFSMYAQYIFNELAQDYQSGPIEYWLGFSYNF